MSRAAVRRSEPTRLHAGLSARDEPNPSAGAFDAVTPLDRLAEALNDALPQTQCTRCGFPDCRGYALAIAANSAPINRCPPGGAAGIARLARLTGMPVAPLDPAHGVEAPRRLASIDEAWCIGCTLCLSACPVDCIVGAPKLMHTVVAAQCTGCELCLPACPVDCISLLPAESEDRTGWAAWSEAQAGEARHRYAFHQQREQRDARANEARLAAAAGVGESADATTGAAEPAGAAEPTKHATIQAALARARAVRLG